MLIGVCNMVFFPIHAATTWDPAAVAEPRGLLLAKFLAKAKANFAPLKRGPAIQLAMSKGDEVTVLDDSMKNWWRVRNAEGNEGKVPSNYLVVIEVEPPAGLDRDVVNVTGCCRFASEMKCSGSEFCNKAPANCEGTCQGTWVTATTPDPLAAKCDGTDEDFCATLATDDACAKPAVRTLCPVRCGGTDCAPAPAQAPAMADTPPTTVSIPQPPTQTYYEPRCCEGWHGHRDSHRCKAWGISNKEDEKTAAWCTESPQNCEDCNGFWDDPRPTTTALTTAVNLELAEERSAQRCYDVSDLGRANGDVIQHQHFGGDWDVPTVKAACTSKNTVWASTGPHRSNFQVTWNWHCREGMVPLHSVGNPTEPYAPDPAGCNDTACEHEGLTAVTYVTLLSDSPVPDRAARACLVARRYAGPITLVLYIPHGSNTSAATELLEGCDELRLWHGNFNSTLYLDHFSRIYQLYTTAPVLCTMSCLAPMPIRCRSNADRCLTSDDIFVLTNLREQGRHPRGHASLAGPGVLDLGFRLLLSHPHFSGAVYRPTTRRMPCYSRSAWVAF